MRGLRASAWPTLRSMRLSGVSYAGTEKSPGCEAGAKNNFHAKFNCSKHSAQEYIEQFGEFAASVGHHISGEIIADGEVQRFGPNDAWAYFLHPDGVPNGWIGTTEPEGDTIGRRTGESSIMRNASAPTLKLRQPKPSVTPTKQIAMPMRRLRLSALGMRPHQQGKTILIWCPRGSSLTAIQASTWARPRCPDLA